MLPRVLGTRNRHLTLWGRFILWLILLLLLLKTNVFVETKLSFKLLLGEREEGNRGNIKLIKCLLGGIITIKFYV